MKQKHMEFKFEAVDHLRKKSIGMMANTWKLVRSSHRNPSTKS